MVGSGSTRAVAAAMAAGSSTPAGGGAAGAAGERTSTHLRLGLLQLLLHAVALLLHAAERVAQLLQHLRRRGVLGRCHVLLGGVAGGVISKRGLTGGPWLAGYCEKGGGPASPPPPLATPAARAGAMPAAAARAVLQRWSAGRAACAARAATSPNVARPWGCSADGSCTLSGGHQLRPAAAANRPSSCRAAAGPLRERGGPGPRPRLPSQSRSSLTPLHAQPLPGAGSR